MSIKTIGIDVAKQVFQIHGVNDTGKKIFSKRVSRSKLAETLQQLPICLIGLEACASAHYWGRKFTKWDIVSN